MAHMKPQPSQHEVFTFPPRELAQHLFLLFVIALTHQGSTARELVGKVTSLVGNFIHLAPKPQTPKPPNP